MAYNHVPEDMMLYSPMEPEGRRFLKGEPWPGDAWSTKIGGEPIGSASVESALLDLIEAQDRIDQMAKVLASKDHDLAQIGKERDDAASKLADAEQAARDAVNAQREAEQIASEVTKERDKARQEAAGLRAKLDKAEKIAA